MSVPITPGTGASSVAGEVVAGLNYQQIQVFGAGGASILGINPDRSINVSVVGIQQTAITGGSVGLLSGNQFVGNVGIASGSVLALASGNQSVSGTVGASIIGTVPVTGNIFVAGSVAAVLTSTVNQSVSGTVGASIIGTIPATQSGTWSTSVMTNVITSIATAGQVMGSVAALQATNPWIITGSVQGSFSPSGNQSVSGTVGASIIGLAPVVLSGSSNASVIVVGGTSGNSSVMLLNGANTIGSVTALQGTNPWIITSSIAGGIFPISGSVAATITNTNVNVGGSVVAFQGTSPFVVNFQNSSIIALQSGSVVSLSVGSVITVLQAASIVGSYAEDATHTSADKGLFTLNVRNDTLSSVTSNDGDYGALTVGPAGEGVTVNAPFTKWIQGTADFRNGNAGASILVIANGTSSVFQYITGVQIANMGSASVLVALVSGGSVLGYTIAPAGGGSNIPYTNALKTPASFGFAASISGVASVLVSAQGFISKT